MAIKEAFDPHSLCELTAGGSLSQTKAKTEPDAALLRAGGALTGTAAGSGDAAASSAGRAKGRCPCPTMLPLQRDKQSV